MKMKNPQMCVRRAMGIPASMFLGVAMNAAAATVVIDEDFDTDDPVNSDPINTCCPGTWVPNNFVPADVPDHSGPDVNFQPQVISDGGNGVGEYVEGRGGGPEYDLDGYLLADQGVSVSGSTVSGSFDFRLVGGEALIGLSGDLQALVDGTDNADPNFSFAPSPNSAILWGLFLGEGFSASSGDTLASLTSSGTRTNISTAQGVGFPAVETQGRLRFDFQYTVGSSVFDSLTVTTVGGGAYNNSPLVLESDGGPVPVTNPGGFDGWFQGNFRDNGAFNANYNTDNILISVEAVEVSISTTVVANVVSLDFDSLPGLTYLLESTSDLVAGGYQSTGAAQVGDGGVVSMYDPAGNSASQNYRVQVVTD